MPSVIEDAPRLQDALNLLQKASSTPPKQRTFKVSDVVDVICRHAFDSGLEQDVLRDVVNLVSVKTHLDQSSVTTLVKNLYPAQRIPSDVVVTIVGALGQGKGKPSPSSQDCLVKWLTTVHEIVEDPSTLSRLYGVLFAMLDMISIRTSLCHLLSLITRRKHVKPFRIQQILELSRGLSNEPALQGLLRIYKDYYPDIILGSASTSRRSFAPLPDAEWREKIFAVQEAYTATDDASEDRHNGFKVSRKGMKRTQVSAIPDVHTYHATEASVTLEGIDNVEDFVEKLEQIEPPGQMVSFLTDSLLQKYVNLRSSSLLSSRIDLWLGACFEDLYQADGLETENAKSRSEVLEGLLKHAQYTKELPSTVSAFLKDYVLIWDGRSDIDTVLALLAYLPLDHFEVTYATFLQPVERTLAGQGPAAVERLMQFYTDLLQRQVCRTVSNTSQYGTPIQHSFVPLVEHVATLAMSLLVSLPSPEEGKAILSAILCFYEKLAASSKPHAIPIILPPMHTVYLLAQQSSPEPFSRLCGIISSYKQAFDEHPKPVKDYYATHITDALNWCLRDIYNILWVSRGLITTERKAAGLYCDPNLRTALNTYLMVMDREYAIGNAFGFSHNPWLNSMSAAAWRAIEEREIEKEDFDRNSIRFHEGPVNQRSLEVLKKRGGVSVDWDGPQGYKVFVLNWMAERGMSGARDLMFATVSDLRGKV